MTLNNHKQTEIYGLALVGGESRRMGQNKAFLSYDGQSNQLERTCALLQSACSQVFVSQRKDQNYQSPKGTEAIYDTLDDIHGPLRGILSAMQAHPEAHWLVLACDLPKLTEATLQKLIDSFRNSAPALTAYRSTYDGLPEPLCAIYPAGSNQELHTLARKIGKSCPRKLLILQDAKLVEQDDPQSLDNINTAEEYAAFIQQ